MIEKWSRKTMIDLLEDDYFISSSNHPSPESDFYWASQISEGYITEEEYELALHAVRLFHASHCDLSPEEISNIRVKIEMNCKRNKRYRKRLFVYISGIAASILIAVYYLFSPETFRSEQFQAKTEIEKVVRSQTVSENVRIVLSEKKQIELKEDAAEIVYDTTGNIHVGAETVPQTNLEVQQQTPYNQVIVPKGKRSVLWLSDGTKLYLNSDSRVVYPPSFDKNVREIFVEGEVFAEVTHDESWPFVVKTNRMEISVFGTLFDVSDYTEDASPSVVLVSGSIAVKAKEQDKKKTLKPNEMFKLSGTKIEIREVNVEDYVTWKNGYYVYHDANLSQIFDRLSLYYGISVQYPPEIGELRFTGKLDLKEDISRVMAGFAKVANNIGIEKENNTFYIKFLN